MQSIEPEHLERILSTANTFVLPVSWCSLTLLAALQLQHTAKHAQLCAIPEHMKVHMTAACKSLHMCTSLQAVSLCPIAGVNAAASLASCKTRWCTGFKAVLPAWLSKHFSRNSRGLVLCMRIASLEPCRCCSQDVDARYGAGSLTDRMGVHS